MNELEENAIMELDLLLEQFSLLEPNDKSIQNDLLIRIDDAVQALQSILKPK